MLNEIKLNVLQDDMGELFGKLMETQYDIRRRLENLSDGKILKGDEVVGWIGEIYGKILMDGKLVSDDHDHDFITSEGLRVSVKTRKGFGRGWQTTSAIPSIESDNQPTHLMFIHLNDNYRVDKIWLYSWKYLLDSNRFTKHIVRNNLRSYKFRVNPKLDEKFLVYC